MIAISPKDKTLQIRLSDSERVSLENAAKKAGFESIAAFIRAMASKEHADQKVDEQNVILAEIRDSVRQILEKMDK